MRNLKLLLLPLCTIALTAIAALSVTNIYYAIKDHTEYVGTFTHHGHTYILVHSDGASVVTHDPDCPCQEKGGDQ